MSLNSSAKLKALNCRLWISKATIRSTDACARHTNSCHNFTLSITSNESAVLTYTQVLYFTAADRKVLENMISSYLRETTFMCTKNSQVLGVWWGVQETEFWNGLKRRALRIRIWDKCAVTKITGSSLHVDITTKTQSATTRFYATVFSKIDGS